MNKSIIYYSSNNEDPVFERKIMDNIQKQAGDIPIISVTRKPTDFGWNICIGEQPICYSNSFKQLLIGLKEASTEFCLAAESDVLYPPEYFTFTPPENNRVYRYTNVWVHFAGRNKFWRKKFSEGIQMCGREHWIKSIEAILEKSDWDPEPLKFIFPNNADNYWTGNPAITFKTRNATTFKTGYQNKDVVTELPYWGTALDVKRDYL